MSIQAVTNLLPTVGAQALKLRYGPKSVYMYTLKAYNCGLYYKLGDTIRVRRLGEEISVYLEHPYQYFNCFPNDGRHNTSNMRDFQPGHKYRVVEISEDYLWLQDITWPRTLELPVGA